MPQWDTGLFIQGQKRLHSRRDWISCAAFIDNSRTLGFIICIKFSANMSFNSRLEIRFPPLTLQVSAGIEEAGTHWPSLQGVQPPHLYPCMHVQTTPPADQGQRSRRVFVASSLTCCLNLMTTLFDNSKRHTNVDTYSMWDPHRQYFCRASRTRLSGAAASCADPQKDSFKMV